MTKKELLKRIDGFPSDAEIIINEKGSCYEWRPTNVFLSQEGTIILRNYTNKSLKKSKWGY